MTWWVANGRVSWRKDSRWWDTFPSRGHTQRSRASHFLAVREELTRNGKKCYLDRKKKPGERDVPLRQEARELFRNGWPAWPVDELLCSNDRIDVVLPNRARSLGQSAS